MGNITQGKLGACLRDTVKGLLPCPFCGGEVTLWNYEFGTVKVFECKACRTRFIFPWDKDVSEWNHRVSEKSAQVSVSQRNEGGVAENEMSNM